MQTVTLETKRHNTALHSGQASYLRDASFTRGTATTPRGNIPLGIYQPDTGFGTLGSSVDELAFKRLSSPLTECTSATRPLRSIPITGLPRYYGPIRFPCRQKLKLCISPATSSTKTPWGITLPYARLTPEDTGLPGSSTDLSLCAIPLHPGEPNGLDPLLRHW